jgi:hypothetical protein
MAIRGPQPKAQARNRNPLIHEWTEVERIAFEGGPELPPRRANEGFVQVCGAGY